MPASRQAAHAAAFAFLLIAGLYIFRHEQLALGRELQALRPYKHLVASLRASPDFLLRDYHAQPRHDIADRLDEPGSGDRPRLVVFTDFECPACYCDAVRLREMVLPAFGGQLLVTIRHYPLCRECNPNAENSGHPNACDAACAAEAARLQGGPEAFGRMCDLLFENRKHLGPGVYRELAARAGLDPSRFDRDFAGPGVRQVVREDITLARRLGIEGTPALFLNGRRVTAFGADNPVFWRTVAEDFSSSQPPLCADSSRPDADAPGSVPP